LSTKSSRKNLRGLSKVGSRSGVPAEKRRTNRAVRHSTKGVVEELADDADNRAEAKLADRTYQGLHPLPIIETRVLKTKPKKKKRAPQAVAASKKRAALALQKELDRSTREKAQRRAKRRAAARALKEARKPKAEES
jgi:hypothetical protein